MAAACVILNFAVAALKEKDETGEFHFNKRFIQPRVSEILSVQHVIDIKNYRDDLHSLFCRWWVCGESAVRSSKSWVCFTLTAHLSLDWPHSKDSVRQQPLCWMEQLEISPFQILKGLKFSRPEISDQEY